MIFFFCPDHAPPAGGVRMIYRQVDILNAHGIDAVVLHKADNFRPDWFTSDTPVLSVAEATAAPSDIFVVPEVYGHHINSFFTGYKKVIFNQNVYNTFLPYPDQYNGPDPYTDAAAVITNSEDGMHYLHCAFPKANLLRIRYAVDPAHYHPGDAKKPQIAFMPRKNAADAKQVVHMLRTRGCTLPFVVIHDMTEAEAAATLRASQYFLCFGHPEGFGLPPAEAMACGCVTIGYHGMGGREFFRPPYAAPIAFGDITTYVETVEHYLQTDTSEMQRQAAQFIADEYSPKREAESILLAWREILDRTAH